MRYLLLLTLALFTISFSAAQNIVVKGKVTDVQTGEPVIGANVTAKAKSGSAIGVTTDKNGNYTINISKEINELTFSYLGMGNVTRKIDGRTVINIQLKAEINALEEVVVTALGINREAKSLNYSRQSVNSESLTDARTPDFVSSLAGKVAGLTISPPEQNTGSAGIVIRGNSSATGDNNAIFVVDGVIMENGAVGGERNGIDLGNGMGDINPDDIASIEVLKGPNATALYGSRAGNGVIMITTKKAKEGFKLTFSTNTMVQTIKEYPQYQNTFGVGMDLDIQKSNTMYTPNPLTGERYRSWGPVMMGQPYVAIDGIVRPYSPQPNNIKDFYQSAILTTNTATLEGGSKDHNVRFTYANYYGNSIVEKVNIQKKNTFNINIVNKFRPWLELNSRVTYINDDVNNRQYTNSNNRNPVNVYVHMARSASLEELSKYKDENGREFATNRNTSNPYWIINENPTNDTRDRLQAAFNAKAKITKDLTLSGRAGIDMFWHTGYAFQNMGGYYDPIGRHEEFTEFFKSLTVEGNLTYNKRFGKFSVFGMVGGSNNTRNGNRRTQAIIGLIQPGFIHITNSADRPYNTENMTGRMGRSVYASASVGYNDFIYLEATARNDWSSTLPIDNRSFFYPSIGTSFLFSEAFSLNSNVISFGKMRFSYAKAGNDTSPYRFQTASYGIGNIFNSSPYSIINTTMNNPLLEPELTHSFEAGLEMKFAKNRFGFDFTWYRAATFNQIIPADITNTSGYQKRMFNAGEIRNSGIEISAYGDIIRGRSFSWNTQINFAKNNSLVVSLLGDVKSLTLYNASNTYVVAEVGKPYGYIRGVGVLTNEAGQLVMEDGASPGAFVQIADKGLGTHAPKWTGGITNTFTYKGISLSVLVDARIGGIMYSNTFSKMMTNGMTTVNYDGRLGYFLSKQIYNENDNEMTHGITWPNAVQRVYDNDGKVIGYKPVTKYFSPSGYEYTRSSINEFSVFGSSFVKLREITLGYSLPAKILKKTFFGSLRVSFVARNPWTIYQQTPQGIDPESAATTGNGRGIENGSLPPIRTIGFDIKFTTK